MMKQLLIGMVALLMVMSARADHQVVAHYKLTDPEALGQVQGPEVIKNRAADSLSVKRVGAPRYMNVPPDRAESIPAVGWTGPLFLLVHEVPAGRGVVAGSVDRRVGRSSALRALRGELRGPARSRLGLRRWERGFHTDRFEFRE